MITMNSNIKIVTTALLKKLEILRDPKPLLRPVAFDVLAMVTERIHEKGLAADGSQIGTYNSQYLKLRQKKFKRNSDSKITVSLTRQLENDWAVIASPTGWGIGFNNPLNAQKMKWVEQQKNKRIAALTTGEKDYAITKLKKLMNEAIA